MAADKRSGLATVQNLYLLQVELAHILRSDLQTSDDVKQAKLRLKEFSQLLNEADWHYMGGEDVYEALQMIRRDVGRKIERTSGPKRKAAVAKVKAKVAAKKKRR